jgi:hypothetical protein
VHLARNQGHFKTAIFRQKKEPVTTYGLLNGKPLFQIIRVKLGDGHRVHHRPADGVATRWPPALSMMATSSSRPACAASCINRMAPARLAGPPPTNKNVKFNGFMRGHGFPPLFKSGCPNGGKKMPLNGLNAVQEISDSLIYH